MFGTYTGKVTYSGKTAASYFELRPPKPILIPGKPQAVQLWVRGNNWGWHPKPKTARTRVRVVVQDAKGEGFDIDLQLCVDPVDNGALSSCPAGEGHTWGKVSADCMESGSVYLHCDVTAVLPFMVHALFSEGAERTPRRFYDRLDEARGKLDVAVAEKRDELLAELE